MIDLELCMSRTFVCCLLFVALVLSGGCDRERESEGDDRGEEGSACAEEELDEAWTAVSPDLGADVSFRAVLGLLHSCSGLDDEFQEVAEDLEVTEPAFRLLEVSRTVRRRMDLWKEVCPPGAEAFLELETASPRERFWILWKSCSLEERLPVGADEIVANPSMDAASLFLLVVGADGGRVGEEGRMADFTRLILASEMPGTPFSQNDGPGGDLDGGDLPKMLGGVAPQQSVDWQYESWLGRLGSLGGVVTPRLSDDGERVEAVSFCPLSPFDDPSSLVEYLDGGMGEQVERSDSGDEGMAPVYRQAERVLSVTYEIDPDGISYDACVWLK